MRIKSIYESHLEEMARVGYSDDLIIWIWTDDPGFIPHVHVVDKNTKGKILDCCIRLDKAEYFSHGTHNGKLNSSQKKNFYEFMRSPHKRGVFKSNYEYSVFLWNENNSPKELELEKDDNGNVIIPDYSGLEG